MHVQFRWSWGGMQRCVALTREAQHGLGQATSRVASRAQCLREGEQWTQVESWFLTTLPSHCLCATNMSHSKGLDETPSQGHHDLGLPAARLRQETPW